jgi:hypothetical protein
VNRFLELIGLKQKLHQGSAPDTKRYVLYFVDNTRVSFAPDNATM